MRILDQNLVDVLNRATRRTTLSITLGDASVVHYSTGTYSFGGINYLGKLAPVDALNLETTAADEGVNLRIENVVRVIGQDLINNADKLDGTAAVLGCYFRAAAGEWHDTKLPGFIETGDIDGDWINIFFQSSGAKQYYGKTIAELFPDVQIPAAQVPDSNPVFVPDNIVINQRVNRKFTGDQEFDDFRDFGGRNYLPDFDRFEDGGLFN